MELFKIERYEGEVNLKENRLERESRHLAQLLEEARERKRSRKIMKLKHEEEVKSGENGELAAEATATSTSAITLLETKEKLNEFSHDGSKKKRFKGDISHKKVRISTDKNKMNKLKHADTQLIVEQDDSVHNKSLIQESDSTVNDDNCSDSKIVKDSSEITSKKTTSSNEVISKTERTVIGRNKTKEKQYAVQRNLPRWLASPFFFSSEVNKNLVPVSKIAGLSSYLSNKLEENGIRNLFPVQSSVIPAVLESWERVSLVGKGGFVPQDICVCAPTGSGKTLAYVLPLIELLSSSNMRRLEALVVVPTKDLATQVWNVFDLYVRGTGLHICLANGLKTFQKEQQQILGSNSNVNVLVATPGRLVEHLSNTNGFTLQYLRFLIIDEADRLLAEPYFSWLERVYESVFCSKRGQISRSHPRCLTPLGMEKIQKPLQKLLFSATLTQNPEKLAPLRLYRPKYFTVSKPATDNDGSNEENEGSCETFLNIPSTLKESIYICNNGEKPLVLLYLLVEQSLDGVLCFTSSVESTHRLFLLVRNFGEITAQEFSSNLSATNRQTILNEFKCGHTQIIICSDAMSRGLDVPSVKYVISYDPPVSSKTYVHRIGRTARAGNKGTAITLLHDNEVFHFKKMRKSLKTNKIDKVSVKSDHLQGLMERYESALELLKSDITKAKKQHKRKHL